MNKLYIGVAAAARRTRRVKETCDLHLHNQVSTWQSKSVHFPLSLADALLLQQAKSIGLFNVGCATVHQLPVP